jgi:hypothetical protein
MRLIIEDTKHLHLAQDMLWVGTFTLVTVIIWISYSIYLTFTKPIVDPDISRLLEPLNPTLDQATLQNLNSRFNPPTNINVLTAPNGNVATPAAIIKSPNPSPSPHP